VERRLLEVHREEAQAPPEVPDKGAAETTTAVQAAEADITAAEAEVSVSLLPAEAEAGRPIYLLLSSTQPLHQG